MNINSILKKSWQILWQYRVLWLFGAVLALVGTNWSIASLWPDLENNNEWILIKLTEDTTVRVPGAELTIDFTAPEGVRVTVPDGASWRDFHDAVEELNREEGIRLWPILIELAVILVLSLLLAWMARYVAETAVIRMVDYNEETGKRLSFWTGLRRGFSIRAARLFLLDFIIGVFAILAFVVVFGLAVTPILVMSGSQEAVLITVGVGTVGLLVLAGWLWFVASAVLSLVLQPIRRACALEDQSLLASIRQGLRMTQRHLKEVGLLWLIWMAIRLAWVPISVLVLILLSPILLLMVLLGVVLGGVPAALMAAFTSLFMGGVTPWIMGALLGLPTFIIVTMSPMLFVGGLVDIYKSSIWTLGYRDLRAIDHMASGQTPQVEAVSTPDTTD